MIIISNSDIPTVFISLIIMRIIKSEIIWHIYLKLCNLIYELLSHRIIDGRGALISTLKFMILNTMWFMIMSHITVK